MQGADAINYLRDLGQLLKEKAIEAKANSNSSLDSYDAGYRMALYEVISLMQSQAGAFGIPLEEIAIADIDPESDLL